MEKNKKILKSEKSKERIISLLDLGSTFENFYNLRVLNYKGRVKESGVFYSEVIAEELLQRDIGKLLENIEKITRTKSYFVHEKKIAVRKKNRVEGDFAKKLFNGKKTLGNLGKVIECQVPLKDTSKSKAGKIDLISRNSKGDLYLIELKYGTNKETLLRAVLEIVTYYHRLNRAKLIEDFSRKFKELSGKVRKAVLLGEDTQAYREAKSLSERPNLKRLIDELGVEIFSAEHSYKKI